jgi:hypothetical protein
VVKILDLGLALTTAETSSLTQTHGESILGTTDYMSPEQAVDSHRVDGRSDIYSLGCTLYFLLTGEPPFPGGTIAEKLAKHQMKDPVNLREKRPDIPPPLADISRKMMAKAPGQRYQTAAELQEELSRWLQHGGWPGQNVDAMPPRRTIRPRLPYILAATAALAFLVIGLWWAFRGAGGGQFPSVRNTLPAPTSPTATETARITGKVGKALLGDGVRGGELLAPAKDLNPPEFTVMAWIKVGKRDPGAANDPVRYVFFTGALALGIQDDNCIIASAANGDGERIVVVSEPDAVKPGQWFHIAATCDGASLRAIVDGKIKGQRPIGKPRTNLGAAQGFIGQGPANERFAGLIDEVRLYNRALTTQETRACSNEAKPVIAAASLLRHWTFD